MSLLRSRCDHASTVEWQRRLEELQAQADAMTRENETLKYQAQAIAQTWQLKEEHLLQGLAAAERLLAREEEVAAEKALPAGLAVAAAGALPQVDRLDQACQTHEGVADLLDARFRVVAGRRRHAALAAVFNVLCCLRSASISLSLSLSTHSLAHPPTHHQSHSRSAAGLFSGTQEGPSPELVSAPEYRSPDEAAGKEQQVADPPPDHDLPHPLEVPEAPSCLQEWRLLPKRDMRSDEELRQRILEGFSRRAASQRVAPSAELDHADDALGLPESGDDGGADLKSIEDSRSPNVIARYFAGKPSHWKGFVLERRNNHSNNKPEDW